MSGHDDVWVFKQGFWFLISTDSAIFRSATSLHTLSIEILKEVEVILIEGCACVMWSPSGVLVVLCFASRICSLNRSLTRLFDSPI